MRQVLLALVLAGLGWLGWQQLPMPLPARWAPEELALLGGLALDRLPNLPADPSNAVADDPLAIELGRRLFFDVRLSGNGTVSCATCHQPERDFTDGLPRGVGTAEGDRHTMGLLGVGYSPWHYWDGRKDSLWSQALEPLENPLEQHNDRVSVVRTVADIADYRSVFEALFGPWPDLTDRLRFPVAASPQGSAVQQSAWDAMAPADQQAVNRLYSQIGKVLAAYERTLRPEPAPLDRYLIALRQDSTVRQTEYLTPAQIAGLRLFIGKAQCINCHNGPLLSNFDFHNTGLLPLPGALPAMGRATGLRLARQDPFNCLGPYSDASPDACVELRFAREDDANVGAQKTPSLRNVARTAPYMHGGQLASLAAVVRHYDEARDALVGHNEAKPLALRAVERRQLEQFLLSLSSP